MIPPARLAAAIELLGLIESTPRPADATASAYFRDRRFIGAKDRADISQTVYRTMRRRARLTWRLERAGAEATAAGLILADQLVGEGRALDDVARLFSGPPYGPPPLSSDELALAGRLAGRALETREMPEMVAAECPPWAEAELRRALGDDFRREMDALKVPAPLDLRVNTLKASRPDVLARLEADGMAAKACALSPAGIRLEGRPSVMAHPLYKEGAIEIQDEGSQLVGLLVGARPGQDVVDFCAGAGGKTLAIAATMANKGRIIAADVLANRLLRAKERFRRAGAHNVQTRALASETDPWVRRHKGRFDRVLVDAPCSGAGTWRRNPDMRWRTLGPGLGELLPLQARLIVSAARLVKPGGRLIYATCSLLPAENEDQAEAFLAAHPDFTLKAADAVWRESVWPDGGPEPPSAPTLRLTPARHGTDGFFAAVFERGAPSGAPPNNLAAAGVAPLAPPRNLANIGDMDFFIRPAGPADAEAIAEVQRVSWQAAYRDLLSPESLARVATAWDAVHWRNNLERVDDPIINLVLDSRATGVAGFGVAGPRRRTRDQALSPFDGEIYLLYLLPGVQRHGHGAQLMGGLARVLKARGKQSALVWALTANRPAIAFYRRLSGAIMAQSRRPFFGETVTEIALGWRDIGVLAGMSRNLKE